MLQIFIYNTVLFHKYDRCLKQIGASESSKGFYATLALSVKDLFNFCTGMSQLFTIPQHLFNSPIVFCKNLLQGCRLAGVFRFVCCFTFRSCLISVNLW